MTKDEFVKRRTEIISLMLDNPDEFGIYSTTKCFARLDDLFDEITYSFIGNKNEISGAQKLRNERGQNE